MMEERKVKQRMLGNVRLISQLHKIKVVNEKIILVCLRELIGDDAKVIPLEVRHAWRLCVCRCAHTPLLIRADEYPVVHVLQDNIEALCEIITIVGGTLATSPQAHTRNFLEGYLTRLEKLSKASQRMPWPIPAVARLSANACAP